MKITLVDAVLDGAAQRLAAREPFTALDVTTLLQAAQALRTALYGTQRLDDDPMPVFVLKGKDTFALDVVDAYFTRCLGHGLLAQASEVVDAAAEIRAWQDRHPDLVQLPDHPHEPAT